MKGELVGARVAIVALSMTALVHSGCRGRDSVAQCGRLQSAIDGVSRQAREALDRAPEASAGDLDAAASALERAGRELERVMLDDGELARFRERYCAIVARAARIERQRRDLVVSPVAATSQNGSPMPKVQEESVAVKRDEQKVRDEVSEWCGRL